MSTIKPDFLSLVKMPDMTEEEWLEHDRKIAEARAAESGWRGAWDHVRASLVDRGFVGKHLDRIVSANYTATPALEVAARMKATTKIFCLSGNAGCGKTFAAQFWALGCPARPDEITDTNAGLIVRAAWFARTSRFNRDGEDKFELLAKPKRLVIDDLGVEYTDQKGSFDTDFDELMDIRWSRDLPTLITTNMNREQFKARYSERVVSRIRDDGAGWFDTKAPELRGIKPQQEGIKR